MIEINIRALTNDILFKMNFSTVPQIRTINQKNSFRFFLICINVCIIIV